MLDIYIISYDENHKFQYTQLEQGQSYPLAYISNINGEKNGCHITFASPENKIYVRTDDNSIFLFSENIRNGIVYGDMNEDSTKSRTHERDFYHKGTIAWLFTWYNSILIADEYFERDRHAGTEFFVYADVYNQANDTRIVSARLKITLLIDIPGADAVFSDEYIAARNDNYYGLYEIEIDSYEVNPIYQ